VVGAILVKTHGLVRLPVTGGRAGYLGVYSPYRNCSGATGFEPLGTLLIMNWWASESETGDLMKTSKRFISTLFAALVLTLLTSLAFAQDQDQDGDNASDDPPGRAADT